MNYIEIGICVCFYLAALIIYILRKRKWKKQQEFILYEGKHSFRVNDIIPFVIIIFLVLSFQIQSFSLVGILCLIPFVFICIILIINYSGIGEKGILHFSDQYLYDDIEVYFIGKIKDRYYVNVKGKTSRLHNQSKKSYDSDVAELVVDEADIENISKLFEANVSNERHSEYPIYKRVPK